MAKTHANGNRAATIPVDRASMQTQHAVLELHWTCIAKSSPGRTQKSGENTGKSPSSENGAGLGAGKTEEIDPTLATIVGIWAKLPNAIKAAILALVNAA